MKALRIRMHAVVSVCCQRESAISLGLCGLSGSRRYFGVLATQTEQSQQHVIAFPSQLIEGAASGFFYYAVDDGLLNLGAKFRDLPKVFPPTGCRAGKVIHKMLNPSLTTTQMKQEVGPHNSPTQSRSPAHSSI